jgi:hypothetical protein
MLPWKKKFLIDLSLLVLVLTNWILVCGVTDATTDSKVIRQWVSVYIAVFSFLVNFLNVLYSWSYIGSKDAPRESIIGLFCQICNQTQVWGSLFASARYWSLEEGNSFYANSLMQAESESMFEMSLVQSGTGWAATVPTTAMERVVAWATAYIGGILCTNMFLMSVVLSRRGYWDKTNPNQEESPVIAKSNSTELSDFAFTLISAVK